MISSSLFDETTFYQRFIIDLLACKSEVVVESPFITTERMSMLYPTFSKLVQKRINVYVITRDPNEHSAEYRAQSEYEIQRFEALGVQVFICKGNHHRKLAILDRSILWEGSLNILSQIRSREIMRRIDEQSFAQEMFTFLKLKKYIL